MNRRDFLKALAVFATTVAAPSWLEKLATNPSWPPTEFLEFQRLVRSVVVGNRRPSVIELPLAAYEAIDHALTNRKRCIFTELADAGYENTLLMGIPTVPTRHHTPICHWEDDRLAALEASPTSWKNLRE